LRPADEDAFACGQPIGLHDAGRAGDGERFGRRHAGRLKDVLRERLRALDAGGGCARAEDCDPVVAQLVRDACDERPLWPDDDEVDAQRMGEPEQPFAVLRANRMAAAQPIHPGIAGRAMQLGQPRALRQLPREGVLAAARPNDEHLHAGGSYSGLRTGGGAQDPDMTEPGLDLHEWETWWQQAQEDAEDDPAGALGEMDRVLTEILTERGFQLDEPVTEEGDEPEILRQFLAARDVKLQVDRGEFDPGDVADAIEGYRGLYEYLTADRPAP
jgi:hypothetical protein